MVLTNQSAITVDSVATVEVSTGHLPQPPHYVGVASEAGHHQRCRPPVRADVDVDSRLREQQVEDVSVVVVS